MKYSVKWGQKYSNVDLESIPVEKLSASIGEQLGAIEEIVDLSHKYKDIYIVEVKSAIKHPDSDKLSLCQIDDNRIVKDVKRNKAGLVQIVCGAPNVKEGMKAVWLPPESTVPSSFDSEPFVLSSRELRGEVSHGMLASPKELDLSDEHQGILEVHIKSKYAQPGGLFADAYNLKDVIIDLENKMFTHRPDCFGMLGVARELAGINNLKFISPDWYTQTDVSIPSGFSSKLNIPTQVPRFVVQVIKGIQIKDSNPEIQSLLTRVGNKPINNIVDLTNYYMQLTGQPTHAFDYDKVAKLCSGEVSIFPRMAKDGEELTLLNGKTIQLTAKDIVIATDKQAIALGGVMGGKDTEVDNNTKNIIVECANFNMYTIRRTSMHHGLFTDAVTRFNKGQSTLQNAVVLAKLSKDIVESAGGKIAEGYDSNPAMSADHWPAVKVDVNLINSRLGSDIPAGEMAKLLSNVEFKVDINEKTIAVAAPFWRTDIEIAEDVVEEIGRLYGYDKLPVDLPSRQIQPVSKNTEVEFNNRLRKILSSAGANEILTYSFVSEKLLVNCGQDPKEAYHLSNALSPELQCYRLTLTPSLLSKVNTNIRAGHDKFVIFEIGKTHLKAHGVNNEGLPGELEMFSLVFSANDNTTDKNSGAAYYQAKKYLDYIATKLGLVLRYEQLTEKPEYEVTKPYDWKRSALVSDHHSGTFLGMVGEYTASVRRNLKLPVNTAGFEVNYQSLMEVASRVATYQPLEKYPGTSKDITFDVNADTKHGEIRGFVEHITEELSASEGLIFTVIDLDIYQKPNSKHKSTTLRIEMSHPDKTLTTQQANKISDKIADFVNTSLAK